MQCPTERLYENGVTGIQICSETYANAYEKLSVYWAAHQMMKWPTSVIAAAWEVHLRPVSFQRLQKRAAIPDTLNRADLPTAALEIFWLKKWYGRRRRKGPVLWLADGLHSTIRTSKHPDAYVAVILHELGHWLYTPPVVRKVDVSPESLSTEVLCWQWAFHTWQKFTGLKTWTCGAMASIFVGLQSYDAEFSRKLSQMEKGGMGL